MNKLVSLFKKKWLYLIGFIVVMILILSLKMSQKKPKTSPAQPTGPATQKIASFGEIAPGKTNLERVNELLGSPLKTTEADGKNIFDFKTNNQYRKHQVVVENDIVKLVKEAVSLKDNKNAETIRGVYGIAPDILYEQKSNSVFNLYVYPENGIAYRGHEDGTILEIWYFEPTTIDNFISTWAPGYAKGQYKGQAPY